MPDRYKIGIVGLGAIGLQIAKTIDGGDLPNLDLAAVAARDKKKAQQNLGSFRNVPLITSVEGGCESADVIVECAPAAIFKTIIEKTFETGNTLIPASVGAI